MLVWVYTCQNATLLEISCRGSIMFWLRNKKNNFQLRTAICRLAEVPLILKQILVLFCNHLTEEESWLLNLSNARIQRGTGDPVSHKIITNWSYQLTKPAYIVGPSSACQRNTFLMAVFLSNTGPDPLKITNLSYQASIQCWAIIGMPYRPTYSGI